MLIQNHALEAVSLCCILIFVNPSHLAMVQSTKLFICKAAAEEFQATREAVSLCDYSSFAKMELWSAGREVPP